MSAKLDHSLVDPTRVRIKRKQAAEILGFSTAELDRRRKNDPRCPDAYKENSEDPFAPVYFYLSDIYAYSDAIKRDSIVVPKD